MLIWNHSRTSCRANNIKVERERVITQTARRLVVCLFVCHIWVVHMWKMQSFFSAFSKLSSPTVCLCLTPLLCCKQAMIYGSPCCQSAISDHICLDFFWSPHAHYCAVPTTTRRLCCTKTWFKLQGKQPTNQRPQWTRPTSALWRMNCMWWGNSFLLGSSSLANHGG